MATDTTRGSEATPLKASDGLHALAEDLWFYHEKFSFLGAIPIYNNGLLIRVPATNSIGPAQPFLVAINPVALNAGLADAIEEVERATGAALRYYVGSDWHHMSAEAWADRWPEARYVVPSNRAIVLHKRYFQEPRNALVLSRNAPVIPEAAHALTLLPWLGFSQPPRSAVDGELQRGEVCVLHEATRTLFLFDPILPIPHVAGRLGRRMRHRITGTNYLFKRNFGPMTGFRVRDLDQATLSVTRVAALDAERLVCAHGKPEHGALIEDAEAVKQVIAREFLPGG